MTLPVASGRRTRGEIERLPSGSLRVRVYDGVDPESKKRRYLVETVAAGPAADREAATVRDRLLAEAADHRRRRRSAAPEPPSAAAGTPAATEAEAAPAGLPRRGRRRGEMTVAAVARIAGVSAA